MTSQEKDHIKKYPAEVEDVNHSFLVIAGAMQVRYDQFHPLVQFLRMYGDVYSMGLPGHGQERDFFLNLDDHSFHRVLNFIYTAIDQVCPRNNVTIVAYSLASIMVLKLFPRLVKRNPDIRLILIASTLRVRLESSKLIGTFFNTSTYKKLGWERIMVKQHGETWENTLTLVNTWFSEGANIDISDDDLAFLRSFHDKMLFIIVDRDQPFNKADILDYGSNFAVKEVSGDHFGYFLQAKTWPEVKQLIKQNLVNWNILNEEI